MNSGNPTTAALRLPGDLIDILPPVTVTAYINGSHTTSILYSLYYYDPPFAYMYSYTSTGGGGGNGTAYSYTNLVYSPPFTKHIGSIKDYLGCFTNVAGSTNTYNIRLCVDQPVAGDRTAWGFNGNGTANSSSGANPINVGHTFLNFN